MSGLQRFIGFSVVCVIVASVLGTTASADPFTSSYLDGGAWELMYGQGFNNAVNDGVDPGASKDVPLTRFEFYKGGLGDSASNIKLVIIGGVGFGDGIYANLAGFDVNDPNGPVVGVSTNTIASTAGIGVGAPLRFDFEGVDLLDSVYYGAIFANVDAAGIWTPVQVSALATNYIASDPEDPNGPYYPETNYDFSSDPNGVLSDPTDDGPVDYLTAGTNFLHEDEFGTFFDGFEGGGDANFTAYYDYTFAPEIPGDFNGDLTVDGADLAQWNGDYGVNGDSDSDHDGDSDGVDFLNWQRNFGQSIPPAALAAVPEPGSSLLVFLAAVVLTSAGSLRRNRNMGQRTECISSGQI